jgi:hypothetical protein
VQHVGAGVAVGDRIDVQLVDVVDPRREAGLTRFERAQQGFAIESLCYDDTAS